MPLIVSDAAGRLWRAGPTMAFCSCGWDGAHRTDSHEAVADIASHSADAGDAPGHDTRWKFADLPPEPAGTIKAVCVGAVS